jgi:hypothetical protein
MIMASARRSRAKWMMRRQIGPFLQAHLVWMGGLRLRREPDADPLGKKMPKVEHFVFSILGVNCLMFQVCNKLKNRTIDKPCSAL